MNMTRLLVVSTSLMFACSGDPMSGTPTQGTIPSGGTTATVNAALVGSRELVFTSPQAGAPYTEGQKETFVIGADNTLTAFGKTINNPYTQNGNLAEIIWNDGEHAWALSHNGSGVFNEINVAKASNSAFLGQWVEASATEAPAGVKVEISASGGSSNVTPPWPLSTMVTLIWDGGQALTVKTDAEEITPTYVGEEALANVPPVPGEKDVTHAEKWATGDEDEGYEYVLRLDDSNAIESFIARHYVKAGSGRDVSTSTGRAR